MRTVATLLFAAALVAGEPSLKELLERALRGDETAQTELYARGEPAIPALEALLPKLTGPQQAQTRAVIEEIRRRAILERVSFGVGLPKMRLTTELVNGKDFRFNVYVRNRSKEALVLWPFLALEILDAEGKPLKPTSRRGRFGITRGAYYLEDVEFETIAPGARWTAAVGLQRYLRDPRFITGFQLPGPGSYTLVFTYDYHRRDQLKRAPAGWKPKDDPKRPWNRALELTHSFRQKIRVH